MTGDLSPSANGFHWTDIDQNAPNWSFNEYKEGLRHPLAERQFKVYLQPKYSFQTGRMVGAEALVRWLHPTQGMIRPDWFIPVFEKNGFVS